MTDADPEDCNNHRERQSPSPACEEIVAPGLDNVLQPSQSGSTSNLSSQYSRPYGSGIATPSWPSVHAVQSSPQQYTSSFARQYGFGQPVALPMTSRIFEPPWLSPTYGAPGTEPTEHGGGAYAYSPPAPSAKCELNKYGGMHFYNQTEAGRTDKIDGTSKPPGRPMSSITSEQDEYGAIRSTRNGHMDATYSGSEPPRVSAVPTGRDMPMMSTVSANQTMLTLSTLPTRPAKPTFSTIPTGPAADRNQNLKTTTKTKRKEKKQRKDEKIMLPAPKPTESYLDVSSQPAYVIDPPNPFLVILDLNGTLVYRPFRRSPTTIIARPHLASFLKFLFDNFSVMVWSSARPENVKGIVENALHEELRAQLVASWGRDTFGLSAQNYNLNVQVYKDLSLVWNSESIQSAFSAHGHARLLDQYNTILIDDSALKASAQPYNLLQIPEFEATGEQMKSDILKEVAGYLVTARMQENVSSFMRTTPFVADGTWNYEWIDKPSRDDVGGR